jgi:hypothetical protein
LARCNYWRVTLLPRIASCQSLRVPRLASAVAVLGPDADVQTGHAARHPCGARERVQPRPWLPFWFS